MAYPAGTYISGVSWIVQDDHCMSPRVHFLLLLCRWEDWFEHEVVA